MKSIALTLGSMALVLQNPSGLKMPKDFYHEVRAHLPGLSEQIQEESFVPSQEKLVVDTSNTLSGDLIHLLYGMARKYWLEHQIFPVHSACIGNSKTGYYLLVGENGAGKSTTALSLIANYGAKLYSGDKTLIQVEDSGKLHAIAGTKIMTTRLDTRIGPYQSVIREEDLAKSERNTFQLRDPYVESAPQVAIRGIYVIKAYHTEERNDELRYPSNLFILYPHFVDQERSDVILGLGQRLFNGEVTQEVKEKNMVKLVSAMKGARVRNITGPLEYVARQIADDMEKNSLVSAE